MKPIPFCSFGGYRRFSSYWWKDLGGYLLRGWWHDIRDFWRRGRYGWAPRDTWNLDHYLFRVMAGTLQHLAENTHGAPAGYPVIGAFDGDTDFDLWSADLLRWAGTFDRRTTDDYYELHGNDFAAWHADEKFRRAEAHKALREMEPWFDALWD